MKQCMNSDKINVLLIDDHELILHGIEHILEQIPAVGTVRTARSGQEALELIGRTPFDLSILDIELPDLSGFDLIGHLRSRDPQARIIVNTMHEEIWNIHRLMDCGVNAIILKSANAEELRWAVEAVLGGETYFCRRFRRISERTGRTGTELADCSAPRSASWTCSGPSPRGTTQGRSPGCSSCRKTRSKPTARNSCSSWGPAIWPNWS